MPTTFRKFHAILKHANCAARPAREFGSRPRDFFPRIGGRGYSRHGSDYEKSLPRSLFAANLFSPRRSRRKFDVSSVGSMEGGGRIRFSLEMALFVSRIDCEEIWNLDRGKKFQSQIYFHCHFLFFFFFFK